MKKLTLRALLAATSTFANAGNQDFIQFALKQAHSQNFKGCDTAIKSAFDFAGGEDIRINSDWFKETKNDSLKLTATWGKKGDSIFMEAEFRKTSGKCLMTQTTIITTPKSCTAYASEMSAFSFVAETGDYVWMQNKGKIPMYLTPLNGSCVAIFQKNDVL